MFGDLFYYPAALLHCAGLSLENTYRIIILFINIATVYFGYFAFSRLTGSKAYGVTGAFLYALAYYRIEDITLRADVGEAAGMAFLPLVFLACYLILHKNQNINEEYVSTAIPAWLLLGLSFAGIIVSNIPLTVLCVFFLALGVPICLLLFPDTRSITVAANLGKAALICILLTLFYTVPFLDYYLNANLAVTEGLIWAGTQETIKQVSVNFSQLFSVFKPMSGWVTFGNVGYMPTTIGCALMIIPVTYLLTSHKDYPRRRFIALLFALLALALLMCSSLFPWRTTIPIIGTIIAFLAKVQFSWRFLAIATLLLVVISVFVIGYLDKNNKELAQVILAAALVLSATEALYGITTWVSSNDVYDSDVILENNDGIFDAQFIPASTFSNRPDFSIDTPTIDNDSSSISEFDRNGTHIHLVIDSDGSSTVTLPLLSYPHYQIHNSNDNIAATLASSDKGQIQLNVNGNGIADIDVSFVEPATWRLSEATSLITALALGIYLTRRHLKRHHHHHAHAPKASGAINGR